MSNQFKTPAELAVVLGERLRHLRIRRQMTQLETAERAGTSERAVRDLENGAGSKLETLLRVMKALEHVDALDLLAPDIQVDPMAMLKLQRMPKRYRKSKD
jgi:transcriptional regulator with XRE-family HTH domain